MKPKEKSYTVKKNINGQYEVSTTKNGKRVSAASQRLTFSVQTAHGVVQHIESKTAVVKRLCAMLGVEY